MKRQRLKYSVVFLLGLGFIGTQAQVETSATNRDASAYGHDSVTQGVQQPYNSLTTVTDIDGNIYRTTKIGSQVWMAENLKTTRYNDSTEIPFVADTNWVYLSTPAYCWYFKIEEKYKKTYGALYNWYTINTRKICPTGWHVPTDEEWKTLIYYLDDPYGAGGKLKETSTTHWKSPNMGATNTSGFTALPGGHRYPLGGFALINTNSFWWSATGEYDSDNAWGYFLFHDSSGIGRNFGSKKSGLSIRCLRD